MREIKDQCIWVTGASTGLGKALTQQLAEAGNFVIVSARSQAALTDLALQYPGKIKTLTLDVSHQMNLEKTSEK
ncbi:MAG TPA: SDR family NAD(P)-dependent oxidoreductase, partial [Ferruginibacter sp.]|nr:SDR family NAD(P)-dependent oxidoreductase [Ferruginibacter sp.]